MKSVWDEMQEESLAKGRAEGLAEGIAKGRAEGIAEGRAEEREDLVYTMLKAGELAEKIAEYSGFSLARIQEIAKALA